MTQGIPPSAPPSRRRGNRNPSPQEYTPVNVIMALIGQSRRRCVVITEMLAKQSAGLTQLHMECQQLAGLIRNDPQSLNRLGISLNAARVNLEKNKLYLEEQIQAELFLQGDLQRWLSGEPPTEFAPPPPNMAPNMTRREFTNDEAQAPRTFGYAPPPRELSPRVAAPKQQRSPQLQPRMVQQGPPQQHHFSMPPPSAYAAYQLRPMPQPQQQLPIVRFPVQQYMPTPAQVDADEDADARDEEAQEHHRETGNHHPANGPSAPAIPASDDSDDESTALA